MKAPVYRNRKQSETPDQTRESFYHRKKPQWVTDKVIYLKATNPDYGCRKIAYTFNRLYETEKKVSVSKSFVYQKLKQHRYEVLLLRRKIKHRRPIRMAPNHQWGADLTTVTDKKGTQNQVLVIVDYGSRKCLCLEHLESKHTLNIIRAFIKTVRYSGKPGYLKTDNEAVFKSKRFNLFLKVLTVRHQYSDIASPWQNGRVERLIGTFKSVVNQLVVKDAKELQMLLPEFLLWYNRIRPHNYLDGKTPNEVWYKNHQPKSFIYWRGWGGLLTGFMPVLK